MSTTPLSLQIVVNGADAIPKAMAGASAAVTASTAEIVTQLKIAQQSAKSLDQAFADLSQRGASAKLLSGVTEESQAVQKTIEGLKAQLASVTAPAEDAGNAIKYSMTDARIAAQGLSTELGLRLPRAITSVISHSQTLGPILANAFPVVGALFLAEVIIEKIPAAFNKAIDAMAGWTAQAKADYAELIAENEKYVAAAEKISEGQEKIGLIGLTGSAKAMREFANVQEDVRRVEQERVGLAGKQKQLQDELQLAKDAFWNLDAQEKSRRSEKEIQEDIKKTTELLDEKTIRLRELQEVESPRAGKEVTVSTAEENRKDAAAVAEAEKSKSLSRIEGAETAFKVQQQMGLLTIKDEESAEIEFASERLATELRFLNEKASLTRLEGQQLHKDVSAELTAINAERISAEQKTSDQLLEIGTKFADERKKRELSYTNLVREQDAAQNAATEKSLSEIDRSIEEVFRKKIEAGNKAAAETIKAAEEEASAAERASRQEIQAQHDANEERLLRGNETRKQYWAAEIAATQAAYDKEIAAAVQYLNTLRALGLADETKEKAEIDKIVNLHQQEANALSKIEDQIYQERHKTQLKITNEISQDLTKIITSHQSMSKTLISIYDQLMSQLIDYIIKLGVQWAAHYVMVNLLHISSGQTQAAATAAAAAQEHAITVAANDADIVSEAGVAGAKAYAAYAYLPPLATAMAATAIAEVLSMTSLGSFEEGGIVPTNPMFAMLHKNEMVLPSNLSTKVQNMTESGGGNGGGTQSFHFHYHGSDPVGNMPVAKKAYVTMIKKLQRQGHFNSRGFAH